MIRACVSIIALVLTVQSAAATQDSWPALYDVTGVAADDVLNIRAEPSASAPIVGTLTHSARGVEVIEVNARETWGRVNIAESSGWVSLSFMQRQPGQWHSAFPDVAVCYGTEPFWNLETGPDQFTLSRFDAPEISFREEWRDSSLNWRDRFAFRASAEQTEITGFLVTQACSDGMSDRLYGISVDLVVDSNGGATVLSGCCSLQR